MKPVWIKIIFINLLMAVLLGAFLRLLPIQSSLYVNYRFFVHAHSHIAFLGWVYMLNFYLISKLFISSKLIEKNKYQLQLILTQVSVVGMLVFFPIQGYAAISISFTTLQLLLSYWFFYRIYKDTDSNTKRRISWKFISVGLIFMILSSFGPWALGPIMASGMSGSTWYPLAIYFYLHFQYNGFFSFIIFGLLVYYLEEKNLINNHKILKKSFVLFTASCIPIFALSAFFIHPPTVIYYVGFIGSFTQLIAMIYLIKSFSVKDIFNELKTFWIAKLALLISFLSLVTKLILQLTYVFIDITNSRNMIIGFLHLTLIGFVTLFMISYLYLRQEIIIQKKNLIGLLLTILGFLISETLLFTQGTLEFYNLGHIENFSSWLFYGSISIPIGILLISLSLFRIKRINNIDPF
jgi:hypothetical protein